MWGVGTSDYLVDSLRALMAARANAALEGWNEGDVTYPAVDTTIGYPVIKTRIASERLPLLSVVRRSKRFDWQGKQRVRRSSMIVEWWGPATAADRVVERWPMMEPISECLIDALDGLYQTTNLLDLIGVLDVPEESIAIDYNFAVMESQAFPFFTMRFDVRHTGDAKKLDAGLDELPYLRELFVRYLDGRPATEQPAFETLTRTEMGEAQWVAQDDDLDDDHGEEFE